MALNNSQYDALMREYEETRNINRSINEERERKVLEKFPEIKAFDNRIATLSVQQALFAMDGKTQQAENIQDEITMLRVRRRSELESAGFSEEELEPIYTCTDCQDTGYIRLSSGVTSKCHCFKKRELEILYEQSGVGDLLKSENFSKLSYQYCSGEDLTRLQNAVRICKDFVVNFDTEKKNLVFCGTVGTGKSFLACCIANELIENCHSVMYYSSPKLFDKIAELQFGNNREGKAEFEDSIYNCELLIIDDLGTELTNSFVASALFGIVSERHKKNVSTLITTNLGLVEIHDRYSDRVLSRVTGDYSFVQLSGPDVRQLL